jgi:cytidine deaminase
MTDMTNEQLIDAAVGVLDPKMIGDRLFADVGCALATEDGNLYRGVCIDTASGTGFCAEHSAIAAMVTAGEFRIEKIVAVWKDDDGTLYVLPPCGRCREFMRQIDEGNLDTLVILGKDETSKLKELLPRSEWPIRSHRASASS